MAGIDTSSPTSAAPEPGILKTEPELQILGAPPAPKSVLHEVERARCVRHDGSLAERLALPETQRATPAHMRASKHASTVSRPMHGQILFEEVNLEMIHTDLESRGVRTANPDVCATTKELLRSGRLRAGFGQFRCNRL